MAKLITPFMYEDKLSGLAESFPLSLTDEVKQVITLPVGDTQPAGSGPPATGRFLRGTQQGALLVSADLGERDYISKSLSWLSLGTEIKSADFGRVVSYVMINVTRADFQRYPGWCSSDGVIYMTYRGTGLRFIQFRGRVIYMIKVGTGRSVNIILWGFY